MTPKKTADRAKDAARLDDPVGRTAAALTQSLDLWDRLHPLVIKVLDAAGVQIEIAEGNANSRFVSRKDGKEVSRECWLREVTHDLVLWTEKLSRSLAALCKTADEAARLREFLTGGPDTRPDLTEASDSELLETLIEVAIARGLVGEIMKRAKAAGYRVELPV